MPSRGDRIIAEELRIGEPRERRPGCSIKGGPFGDHVAWTNPTSLADLVYKITLTARKQSFCQQLHSATKSRSLLFFLFYILFEAFHSLFGFLPTHVEHHPINMKFFQVATAAMTAASTAYGAPLEKRAAKVDELVGFAAGTTGGGSGAGTTVASCSELAAAVKVGGVIKIKGTLTGCGIVKVAVSNTSILGVGSNAGLTDGGFQVRKVSNIIIRNLKLYRAPKGKDLVDIDESTKVWVDHNDFSSVGITGDKDTYDGLLDAKHGADSITFSWNKFHDHVSLARLMLSLMSLTFL